MVTVTIYDNDLVYMHNIQNGPRIILLRKPDPKERTDNEKGV